MASFSEREITAAVDLCLPGGAIGFGMPTATGAAIASPGRRVLNLQADGSAMYTMQSLWTQAREGLDVTTVEVQALLPKELVSRPWYQRWYVWAGIGAGLALAGGAAALAASLSREPPDMTRVPGTIEIR